MLAGTVRGLLSASIVSTRCDRSTSHRLVWLASHSHRRPIHLPRIGRHEQTRQASSSSSTRWKTRQASDSYARSAKVAGLKSRAAFKLLEINNKYHLFKRGDTVVDLGYAPGSWSQVAVNRTAPGGRIVGIDIIPVQPPRGVSTLQGDFLSPAIREEVRRFVADPGRGRVRDRHQLVRRDSDGESDDGGVTAEQLDEENKGIVELEKATDSTTTATASAGTTAKMKPAPSSSSSQKDVDAATGRTVNVVLSDMCEPWPLVTSTWIKSVSNPWRRMMNTSGMAFRDHAASMDLCLAALDFSYDTLATGGNFLCKFYQGAEDHALEARLKKLFERVHRIKPDSSRKESKEAYLVGLRRKAGVAKETVLGDG